MGDTHAVRSTDGPVGLPNGDPGNVGGGSYMASSSQPSIEDFEDLFGPAGRDVKQDAQRHKRHQRWHLPDVLKGTNSFLTDRVDGLISDATDSPFTSAILPYQYVDNPDSALSWDVYSYDEGLASRVPYESAARVLTQTKSTHSAYIVRQGLAISMEHNFMMSERGRKDFNNQLLQLVGSIQYTNDLDVHMALITSPNYERTEVDKYAYNDNDPFQVLRKHVDMFGMCQKNPNGLDVLIEDAKQVFKKWGASEPTFMLCNSKLGYQQNMTLEKTQYITNGVDGIKRLKSGPDLKSYRGLNVINSRHFSMEAGRQPRDLLNRRVRVAEHYKLPPMTAREMNDRTVMLYDEGRDQMVAVPCSDLYTASRLDAPTESHLHEVKDKDFNEILSLENDHAEIPKDFWNHVLYNREDKTQSFGDASQKFKFWLNADALTATDLPLNKRNVYHPLFLVKYLDVWDNDKLTFESIMDPVNAKVTIQGCTGVPDERRFVAEMTRLFDLDTAQKYELTIWFRFVTRWRSGTAGGDGMHAICHLHARVDMTDVSYIFNTATVAEKKKIVAMYDKFANFNDFDSHGTQKEIHDRSTHVKNLSGHEKHKIHEGIMYALTYPDIAMAYSKTDNWHIMVASGYGKATVPSYSLFIVRPSIEHYMLGIIVGRGGTGELGATLWGQTELSCYDDAMHGKWGMNYKYHARAVVFNEKHLLRLWDVSFNGYTGGMGTNLVNWTNEDEIRDWHDMTNQLDEPLKHHFPDMFVMRFNPEAKLDGNLPNPINFSHSPGHSDSIALADPENIYNTHQASMDIFRNMALDVNKHRYAQYHHRMPKYASMHATRKTAGHSSHEGDTHTASLSFTGTMQIKQNQTGQTIHETRGTGHCGDSYAGSASIRAGNGSMAMGAPAPYRIM
jgi:hypothetical protein